MFYTCTALRTHRHPTILKTQNLVDTARWDNYKPECYFSRGLKPKANTTPTMEAQWWANCIGHGDKLPEWEGPIAMFIDGCGDITQMTIDYGAV
eukprot:5944026-Karenia_brevis.AAC.1